MTTVDPETTVTRPSLAIWKFSSCDGCQLSLLDLEDHLLAIADRVDIAFFPEASSDMRDGPYDVSLVEGSVATSHDRERLERIRADSGLVVSIGACATSGGVQAGRNGRELGPLVAASYDHPEWLDALPTSEPIASLIDVDLELRGCPVDTGQLLEVVAALLAGRRPQIPTHPVCVECKARGTTCVIVADGTACLGPVTQAGCGALCPSWGRGCFGCFGPSESANADALADHLVDLGVPRRSLAELFGGIAVGAPAFGETAARLRDRGDRS